MRLPAALALLLAAGPAAAVPAFLQLHHQRGIAPVGSCALCHTGGAGGKLNDYGRAFMKEGADFKAFAALDAADADGDGAASADELKAGSNPGDPASTPKRPGAWLKDVKLADQIPVDELAELFPRAGRFEYKEYELSDAEADELARALGAPLSREDRLGTLYFPVDTKATPPARTGVAAFGASPQPEGLLTTAVAVDAAGTITRAWGALYAPDGRDSLKELAKQLVGKPLDAPLVLGKGLKPIKGKRKLSEQGVLGFRKSLLVISAKLAAR